MATVRHPLFISGRLMAALKIDNVGTLHLEVARSNGEGRLVYKYVIEDESGKVLEEGSDLRSGVGADVDYLATMGTLLSFLTAAAESYRYGSKGDPEAEKGENEDLFKPATTEWAYQNSDELTMAQMECEEMFYVEVQGVPDVDEPIGDDLTYSEAVALVTKTADEWESEGWTLDRGWASRGNYAAARGTKEGKTSRFVAVERDEE